MLDVLIFVSLIILNIYNILWIIIGIIILILLIRNPEIIKELIKFLQSLERKKDKK
jgi:hypothetical protein